MPLPLRIRYGGQRGVIGLDVTVDGLGFSGKTMPRLDLTVHLWDALVTAIALGEIDLTAVVGAGGAARRQAEAAAALQRRLRGT